MSVGIPAGFVCLVFSVSSDQVTQVTIPFFFFFFWSDDVQCFTSNPHARNDIAWSITGKLVSRQLLSSWIKEHYIPIPRSLYHTGRITLQQHCCKWSTLFPFAFSCSSVCVTARVGSQHSPTSPSVIQHWRYLWNPVYVEVMTSTHQFFFIMLTCIYGTAYCRCGYCRFSHTRDIWHLQTEIQDLKVLVFLIWNFCKCQRAWNAQLLWCFLLLNVSVAAMSVAFSNWKPSRHFSDNTKYLGPTLLRFGFTFFVIDSEYALYQICL